MKKILFILFFIFAMPATITSLDEDIKTTLGMQAQQLKYMLTRSNEAYIQSTPMHTQSLTLHWYMTYFGLLFRATEGQYAYNTEVLLNESQKLADVISAIENLQNTDDNYNLQVNQLMLMLVRSNDAYINSTPMYQQNLNLEWWLTNPLRSLQGSHCYNAEITLTESQRLASVILAMSKFKRN